MKYPYEIIDIQDVCPGDRIEVDGEYVTVRGMTTHVRLSYTDAEGGGDGSVILPGKSYSIRRRRQPIAIMLDPGDVLALTAGGPYGNVLGARIQQAARAALKAVPG